MDRPVARDGARPQPARPARRRTLVERVAGNAPLPPDVIEEIVKRTDGVPLFVEEMTKAVLEAAPSAAGDCRAVPSVGACRARDPAGLADGAARPARAGCQKGGADRRCHRP